MILTLVTSLLHSYTDPKLTHFKMNTVKTAEIEKPGFTEFKLKSNQ